MTLSADLRAAYGAAGAAWSAGPTGVYAALAVPLVDEVGPVAGLTALDVGTGGGSVADLLRARGAEVVASDQALGMLRAGADRPPAVVADVAALPFVDGSVDVVTAGFVLNHLADPGPAVRELARVGRRVVATTFAEEAAPEVKRALHEVALAHGYRSPAWYDALPGGPLHLPSPQQAMTVLLSAGLRAVRVERAAVVLPLRAEQVLAWRWGMAQYAPFVGGLDPALRAALDAAALARLPEQHDVTFAVLVMSGQPSS